MILMQTFFSNRIFSLQTVKTILNLERMVQIKKLELIICDRISVKTRIVAMRFTVNKQKMFYGVLRTHKTNPIHAIND